MALWTSPNGREACGTMNAIIEVDFGSALDIDVLSIGDLSYEFDIPEDEEESKSISMIIGDCSIDIRDYLSNSASAYDVLTSDTNAIDGDGDFVDYKVAINLLANSGNQYRFNFYFNKPDISTDDITKVTSIKLRPFQGTEKTVFEYFAGDIRYSNGINIDPSTYEISVYGATNTLGNVSVFAGDFIDDILKTNDASGTFLLKSNNLALIKKTDASALSFYSYIPDDQTFASGSTQDLLGANSLVECFEVVGTLAATEGAIFGSSFGYNFFVSRVDTTDNVELSYNDLEDLSVVTTSRPFYSINVDYGVGAESNVTIYNRYSRKTFSYQSRTSTSSPSNGFLYYGEYNGTDAAILSTRRITGNGDKAVKAYAAAFSADGSTHIEATIFGIDSVLPHQSIKFDSSVPERYRNKHYRISSAEYSFSEDVIKIKAYQID